MEEIIYKSPNEYDMRTFFGFPVYYITEEEGIYKLKQLDTETKEYEALLENSDFSKLADLAVALDREIFEEIQKASLRQRDEVIKAILPLQKKRLLEIVE